MIPSCTLNYSQTWSIVSPMGSFSPSPAFFLFFFLRGRGGGGSLRGGKILPPPPPLFLLFFSPEPSGAQFAGQSLWTAGAREKSCGSERQELNQLQGLKELYEARDTSHRDRLKALVSEAFLVFCQATKETCGLFSLLGFFFCGLFGSVHVVLGKLIVLLVFLVLFMSFSWQVDCFVFLCLFLALWLGSPCFDTNAWDLHHAYNWTILTYPSCNSWWQRGYGLIAWMFSPLSAVALK